MTRVFLVAAIVYVLVTAIAAVAIILWPIV
jgi:hypothetical protein